MLCLPSMHAQKRGYTQNRLLKLVCEEILRVWRRIGGRQTFLAFISKEHKERDYISFQEFVNRMKVEGNILLSCVTFKLSLVPFPKKFCLRFFFRFAFSRAVLRFVSEVQKPC